jgi:hypothetical protein
MRDIREMAGANAKVLQRPEPEVVELGITACELMDDRNPAYIAVRLIRQRNRVRLDEAIAVLTSAVNNICPKHVKELGD